jgi:hypothetical protein
VTEFHLTLRRILIAPLAVLIVAIATYFYLDVRSTKTYFEGEVDVTYHHPPFGGASSTIRRTLSSFKGIRMFHPHAALIYVVIAFIAGCWLGPRVKNSQWFEGLTPIYALLCVVALLACFAQIPEAEGNFALGVWFVVSSFLFGCLLRDNAENMDSPNTY